MYSSRLLESPRPCSSQHLQHRPDTACCYDIGHTFDGRGTCATTRISASPITPCNLHYQQTALFSTTTSPNTTHPQAISSPSLLQANNPSKSWAALAANSPVIAGATATPSQQPTVQQKAQNVDPAACRQLIQLLAAQEAAASPPPATFHPATTQLQQQPQQPPQLPHDTSPSTTTNMIPIITPRTNPNDQVGNTPLPTGTTTQPTSTNTSNIFSGEASTGPRKQT